MNTREASVFVYGIPFRWDSHQLAELVEGLTNGEVVPLGIFLPRPKVGIAKPGQNNPGYGFVRVLDEDEAARTISALDGFKLDGRTLSAQPAKPKARVRRES